MSDRKSKQQSRSLSPDDDLVATVVQGHTFTISTRYVPKKILGRGSFGVVCTAFDNVRGENIAIKRIRPFANDEWDARHTLREIRLLKLLGSHPNIISLYDLSKFDDKSELYMMMELMDCDLHRIIQSKQSLNDMHFKCFAKQMLEGIKAMHMVGVFHRDLKPGNILVSKDCQLRITDFGLARFMDDSTLAGENRQNPMTEYVVTRWYRCPELLLAPNRPYSQAIDLWSIGCILGELIHRKPLFPGKSHANQVQLILEVRGYSSPEDLGFPLSQEASSFLDRRCQYPGQPLATFIPEASRETLELLEGLLSLDPKKRPSAEEALADSYFSDAQLLCDYTNIQLERPDREFFDFEQEKYTLEALREMIIQEVNSPCGPYIPNRASRQAAVEVEPPLSYRGPGKDDDEDEDPDGPRSQAKTQVRPSHSQSNHTSSSGGGGSGGDQGKRSSSDQSGSKGGRSRNSEGNITSNNPYISSSSNQNINNNNNNGTSNTERQSDPLRRSLSHSDTSNQRQIQAAANADQQISTKSAPAPSPLNKRSSTGSMPIANSPGRRTPRTPSPRKMESIVQKDRKQKKLFNIQSNQRMQQQLQQQQQQLQQNENGIEGGGGGGGVVKRSSVGSSSHHTGATGAEIEEDTSYRSAASSKVSEVSKHRGGFERGHIPSGHCLPLPLREKSDNTKRAAPRNVSDPSSNIFSHLHTRYQGLTGKGEARVHYEASDSGGGIDTSNSTVIASRKTKLPTLRGSDKRGY